MKRTEITPEKRKEKIVQRQTLNQRKHLADRRFHPVEDDETIDAIVDNMLYGEDYFDETDD